MNTFLFNLHSHPCEGRDPVFDFIDIFNCWMSFAGLTAPALAGMTVNFNSYKALIFLNNDEKLADYRNKRT